MYPAQLSFCCFVFRSSSVCSENKQLTQRWKEHGLMNSVLRSSRHGENTERTLKANNKFTIHHFS